MLFNRGLFVFFFSTLIWFHIKMSFRDEIPMSITPQYHRYRYAGFKEEQPGPPQSRGLQDSQWNFLAKSLTVSNRTGGERSFSKTKIIKKKKIYREPRRQIKTAYQRYRPGIESDALRDLFDWVAVPSVACWFVSVSRVLFNFVVLLLFLYARKIV